MALNLERIILWRQAFYFGVCLHCIEHNIDLFALLLQLLINLINLFVPHTYAYFTPNKRALKSTIFRLKIIFLL